MINKEYFLGLLEAYLAGSLTPPENLAFMKLIKSGEYDQVLQEQLDESLFHATASADMDKSRSEDLLKRIIGSEEQTAKLIPVSKPFRNSTRWWMAAAAMVVLAVSAWWLIPVSSINKSQQAQETEKVVAPPDTNGKKFIRLQDGSTVLLNEGSKLEYPDEFKGDKREIVLTGEGYFDIRHDPARPFVVHTGKVNTTVLGTAFNIKAYPGQKQVVVTVTRGKVSVSDEEKTLGVITPNESISVNTASNLFTKEKVDAEEIVEWKKQYLILDNLSMKEAAALINSRYHVAISFSNDRLKDCVINATFLNNENLEHVLKVVTGIVNAEYTLQPNDQVIITGEGCID